MSAKDICRPQGKLSWLKKVGTHEERRRFIQTLTDAPVMIEIHLPSGRRAGFVHAGVPYLDWHRAALVLEGRAGPQLDRAIHIATTSRTHARLLVSGIPTKVEGIDHVFLGHMPRPDVQRIGRSTLCDTSRTTRPVRVIDVERHMNGADVHEG